jgi:hypothetical protein
MGRCKFLVHKEKLYKKKQMEILELKKIVSEDLNKTSNHFDIIEIYGRL